jgi:hypothetical protein
VQGLRVKVEDERGEGQRAEDESGQEAGAVAVVEAVAGFEVGVVGMVVEDAGV